MAGVAIYNWILTEQLEITPRKTYNIDDHNVQLCADFPESAVEMRENLKDYFIAAGSRHWQYEQVLCARRKNL